MRLAILATASAAVLLSACAGTTGGGPSAEAKLAPTRGSNTTGTVTFMQVGDGVRVSASASGLTPGAHGFHIHEKGDCSAPDGMSAGGHFNPGGHPHGHPHMGPHHAGDMPMLETDSYGNARLSADLPGVTLEGATGIVGKGVIVHAAPDDFKTQPTGNSGARMACGVIVKH
ncbi:MAG: superoxide dismutase [Rhodocyclaceae bacterium]|jgi:Cu-Zn family superoxide dismutase|nr:superoxide dismutase [Rhodocyclaceae bacterium]